MTSLPTSSSESHAFDLLHATIRRWIWQQGWAELRDIQERAIPVILRGDTDVIVAAATAAGKTEAAFLPVLSAVAEDAAPGFKALYVSPLKALINDQFRRLESLCKMLELPVVKWHGDASAAAKQKARRNPQGIVLITPESLEALLARRGAEAPGLFRSLRYVVVDELHAFIGTERGMQLQSLLHRLERAADRRVARIGLSATLGDMRRAAEVLRVGEADAVTILKSRGGESALKLQLRGYVEADGNEADADSRSAAAAVAEHLFQKLRGTHNLVFAGSRRNVELYADRLRGLSDKNAVPNEFFPHHGNLSRQLREELEERLRLGNLPTTAVCTTTLELGIDIGAVESVAQIGAPRSIAGLRQRLGRSGRRPGKPAVLRLYVIEKAVDADSHPLDRLRLELVQAVAAVSLMLQRWIEPPPERAMHLSTLAHQTMAAIMQHGGIAAGKAFDLLCRRGPFRAVSSGDYAELLRCMGEKALIEQAPDGTLLLGAEGERIVEHYGFYAVFQSPEEYRVVWAGRTLGTMPVDQPLIVEHMIVFAGRRWQVAAVDQRDKVVEVVPAAGGLPPMFGGGDPGDLHDRLAEEIRRTYLDRNLPNYLDATAASLLEQGQATFDRLGLQRRRIVVENDQILLFPWVGSDKLTTLALALRDAGLKASADGILVEIRDAPPEQVSATLHALAARPPPNPLWLAERVENKEREKFDAYLSEDLLEVQIARSLPVAVAPDICARLLQAE